MNAAPLTSAAGIAWDLGDLYSGEDDPAIASDQQQALGLARAFAKAYRGRVAELGAGELAAALTALERIWSLSLRPLSYAQLRFAADTGTARHGALLQAAQQRHSEVREEALFFDLEWQALPEARTAELLAEPALEHYRHFLEGLRLRTPHILSEPEERILEVKSNTGRQAFSRLFDEVVGAIRCHLPDGDGDVDDGREASLQEALAMLHAPERSARRGAADAITASMLSQQRVLTFILNTLVQEHADEDRLRRMPHAMHGRNLDNEIVQESVDALLAACEAKMGMVARYYELKRRLLGLERLYDYDRYAPVATDGPDCAFGEARDVVLQAYRDFAPEMAEIAGRFFERRWIDAELRPGKTGGAFCAATLPEVHPYVLLNYTDTPRDVMTLAHELGHGVHQYLSRPRGLFQFQTPLTTAETASTFGEMLVFRSLMARQTDPRARLTLLCGKLEDSFATIFRQAVMTRFEQGLHAARRERGELDATAIGELWMEANRAMFGDSVELTAGYASWWSYIPHFIHTPFYVYAYCFGELLVLALLRRYDEEGAAFVPKYLELLAAGNSDSPVALLGRMGLDIADPGFWQTGLEVLEEMVAQAEALGRELEGG
ncbi:MAG: M3 family oligoendopeptidase [SAR324 cluster bacterium]|nr:M3 family oligoendopeptidase [SAR324 cluster bacterium]